MLLKLRSKTDLAFICFVCRGLIELRPSQTWIHTVSLSRIPDFSNSHSTTELYPHTSPTQTRPLWHTPNFQQHTLYHWATPSDFSRLVELTIVFKVKMYTDWAVGEWDEIDVSFLRYTEALILFCQHILLPCYRLSRDLLHSAQRVFADVRILSSSDIQNIGLQNDRHTQLHGLSNHRSFSCTPLMLRAPCSVVSMAGSSADLALELENIYILKYLLVRKQNEDHHSFSESNDNQEPTQKCLPFLFHVCSRLEAIRSNSSSTGIRAQSTWSCCYTRWLHQFAGWVLSFKTLLPRCGGVLRIEPGAWCIPGKYSTGDWS